MMPVVSRINYNAHENTFHIRISAQVDRPDGTRYEVEQETSADLGALLSLILRVWSGLQFGSEVRTMMQEPSAVAALPSDGAWEVAWAMPEPHDVGTADPADNLDDATYTEEPEE